MVDRIRNKTLLEWDKHKLKITYEIEPGIFDEKRGNAALLIKNSGFYFIFNPKRDLEHWRIALANSFHFAGNHPAIAHPGADHCGR